MNKFLSLIKNSMFEESWTCNICGDELFEEDKTNVCKKCREKLPYIDGPTCEICNERIEEGNRICDFCKQHKKNFDKAYAVFDYDKDIKKLVHKFKFKGAKYLAESLAYFMFLHMQKHKIVADFIVCVPMSEKSVKKRGYNQAQLLAEHISNFSKIPFAPHTVAKVKNNKQQKGLNFENRQKNVENVFALRSRISIMDQTVLIIDDIYTTGATVSSLANVLKNGGAKEVFVLTLAHTALKS